MISVIVPTFNDELTLAQSLAALVPAAVEGVVSEVLIADGGSTDATFRIADEMGARILKGGSTIGERLRKGAAEAKLDWYLFVRPETTLSRGWAIEVADFIDRAERHRSVMAAVFNFALDDPAPEARRAERFARFQAGTLGLPFPAQGLLISARHYEQAGGFRPGVALADVDLLRRIGKKQLFTLRAEAVVNASRAEQKGAGPASARQVAMAMLSCLNVPTSLLARIAPQRA